MPGLLDIVGQDAAVTTLRQAVARHQPSHAYLFHGPESVGKTTTAAAFATALLCLSPSTRGDACGNCASCRKLGSGTHPDFRVITVQRGAGAGSDASRWEISIDQIRQNSDRPRATPAPMLTDAYYHPIVGDRKVYVIEPADLLSEPAAGALLKLLEEPPPYVVIVLVTSRLGRILPTLRSRCWSVGFRLVARDLIEGVLASRGADERQARLFASLSEGRIGWAVANVDRSEIDAARARTIEVLCAIPTSQPGDLLRLAEELREIARECQAGDASDPEPAGEEPSAAARGMEGERLLRSALPLVLDMALTWFRDLLLVSHGRLELAANLDYADALQQQAARLRPERVGGCILAVLEARKVLQRYANPALATESLLFRLRA